MSDPSRTGMIARDFPDRIRFGWFLARGVGRRGKFVAFRIRRSISWMGLRVQVGIH